MQNSDDPSAARTRRMLELLRAMGRIPQKGQEDALRSACGDDEELFRDVLAILTGDDGRGHLDEAGVAVGRDLVAGTFGRAGRPESLDESVRPTIGRYTLTQLLGEGGMGVVYRADGPEGPVALKVIHSHLLSAPGFIDRFLLEAKIGQQVRHENVVRSHDCSSDLIDGRPRHFLVMELVEGQTLRELLQELRCVPEELCRHVGHEIARGLSAIHDARVIHRDLKPENVLITPDHVVKVMDLGVARLRDEAIRISHTGDFVGSLEYAAPEQFGDGDDPDERADLFALGVLLYELATGKHPYRDETPSKSIKNILAGQPRKAGDVNPRLSAFFEELVHVLLNKDREQRFVSASEVAVVLDQGEQSDWWKARATAMRLETRRPLRRIRLARETALYGRDDELAKLRLLFGQAQAGEGRVLLVDGEAGVGKTRLLDEFVHLLGQDVNFLYGSYPPGGAATVTGAFAEAYREQFGAEGLEHALAEVLTGTPLLVPAFAAVLRGEPPPRGSHALAKDSLQTVFVHATQGLAAQRTTIVLIDDLHFAPPEGLALFSSLAMAASGHRILLVGTMRPGVDEKWIADVDHLDQTARMHVSRLGPKDLAKLLEEVFHSKRLARDLGHQIALKSDGNPFFAFEIIQGLRDGEFIARQPDGSWTTTRHIEDISVPSSVSDLVNARVGELCDDERTLLDVASCLGFEFDSRVAAEALELARIPALQMLGRIEKRYRLVHAAGDRFVFDHHQVQEALYEGLSEPLREEYHAAIAGVLEARGGDPVGTCEHYLRSTNPAAALPYLDAALDRLESGFLNDRAIELADRALPLVEGGRRLEILLRKSARLELLGRKAEQEPVIDEARALAVDNAAMAHVEKARGTMLSNMGRYGEAEEVLKTCLAHARDCGDRSGEAGAARSLGRVFFFQGQYGEAREQFELGLQIFRELGDRGGEAGALGNIGNVVKEQGNHQEALEYFEQDLSVAREIGDRLAEAGARGNIGNVYFALGWHDEAQVQLERSLSISREIGNRHGEAITAGGLGSLFQMIDRYADALEYGEQYLSIAREIGQTSSEVVALITLGTLWYRLGQQERARDAVERCLELGRRIGARYPEGYALRALGDIAEAEGDSASALALANESLALRRELGHRDGIADSLIQISELRMQEGELDAARDAAREARDILREQGLVMDVAHAEATLACLPGGEADSALAALEAAGSGGKRLAVLRWLWQATGDPTHLTESKSLLDERIAHAPEAYRRSMIERVPLHFEIMKAWEAHDGLR